MPSFLTFSKNYLPFNQKSVFHFEQGTHHPNSVISIQMNYFYIIRLIMNRLAFQLMQGRDHAENHSDLVEYKIVPECLKVLI